MDIVVSCEILGGKWPLGDAIPENPVYINVWYIWSHDSCSIALSSLYIFTCHQQKLHCFFPLAYCANIALLELVLGILTNHVNIGTVVMRRVSR